MVEREIVISDGEISLAKMAEEDMKPYFSLCREVSGINDDSNGKIVMNTKKIWNSIVFGERVVYSILDENMNFCGDIELQDADTKTPGIGIEILEEKRNQGIGTKALILFLRVTYKKESIDFYSILIRENNLCSRHVFEKLGAKFDKKLENPYEKILKSMESNALKDGYDEIKKLDDSFISILSYRLIPSNY